MTQPILTAVHTPDLTLALDGLTFDGELLLEIKCPVRGKDSTLWRQVAQGEIPAHYRWQLEHQFLVSKATRGHLYVFDGADGILLEVTPCPERWQAIHAAWDGFMRCIETDTPPPLTERDKVTRSDAAWQAAAETFLRLKRDADAISRQLESAKGELLALANHASEAGCSVLVTRYFKQGPIDYKRIAELAGVNLEDYRQKGRWETRISTTS